MASEFQQVSIAAQNLCPQGIFPQLKKGFGMELSSPLPGRYLRRSGRSVRKTNKVRKERSVSRRK